MYYYHFHTVALTHRVGLRCNLVNDRGRLEHRSLCLQNPFYQWPSAKDDIILISSGCFLTDQSWKPLKCKAKALCIYDPLSALSSFLPVFNWPAWAQLEAAAALIFLSHFPPILVIEPRTSCKHPVTPQILWIILLLLPILALSILASPVPSLFSTLPLSQALGHAFISMVYLTTGFPTASADPHVGQRKMKGGQLGKSTQEAPDILQFLTQRERLSSYVL